MHTSTNIPSQPKNRQLANQPEPNEVNPSLTKWLSKLPKYFLALNSTLSRQVIKEINDENYTAERLALVVKQDPALCLKLYLKAKRQLQERDGKIQGLVHLIGLLGTDQIKNIVRSAPKLKQHSEGQHELFAASLFAAELATKLLPKKHGTRGERFHLPTLLFNAPLWLMWIAAPKLMEQGQTSASKQKQALRPICEKKLGFTLESLFRETQQFLNLPELTLNSLAINYQDDIEFWLKVRRSSAKELTTELKNDKSAKIKLYRPEVGINLINHLVLSIYFDWHGKHIKRWSRLLCNHLVISEEDLQDELINTASELHINEEDSNASFVSGRFSPLYRFRQLHKALPMDQPTGNTAIIEKYLGKLNTAKQSKECFQLAMEALSEGVQAEHSVLLRINEKQIHIALSFGFNDRDQEHKKDLMSSIHLDINECGPLIRKLLSKPMAISVKKSQTNILKEQLPNALKLLITPQPCGIMSLFYDGKPYAIVMCDHHDWNDERHFHFKQIGKRLTQALKQCEI